MIEIDSTRSRETASRCNAALEGNASRVVDSDRDGRTATRCDLPEDARDDEHDIPCTRAAADHWLR